MSRRRSVLAAVAAGILALTLTACAGLPVSGPVKIGREVAEAGEDPTVSFNPRGPSAGMTPQQIVEGFIEAGTGSRNNWSVAKLFLTEDATWNPNTGVTVYTPGQRTVTDGGEGQVSMSITPEASVDGTGAYAPADGRPVSLVYRLVQVGGEWRISEAPDGIVIDRNKFGSVFRSYSLMFFDPTWTYLVPDERWFTIEYAPVRIVQALTGAGASPWLAESVESAFTESAGLATDSVPVRSQVAEVPLRAGAREVDQVTLDRMQTQLEQSLQTVGVREVEMLVDGQPLNATAVAVHSTRVEPRTLILADGVFGFLAGSAIESIPGLSDAVQNAVPDAVEVAADRRTAALRTVAGEVQRVRDDGTWETLDARAGLVAPTLDPDGFVYSVPVDAPAAVWATAPDGRGVSELADAWLGATNVDGMRVSRDGTRVAAVIRDGGIPAVAVAGIIRDENGIPVRLSEPRTLAALPGVGIDLAWIDGSTLAVLAQAEDQQMVLEVPIGGPATSTRAPDGAVAIAAGNESGAVRVLDAEGDLFGQRGATWSPMTSGVAVVAVQQGSPG